MIVPTLDGTGKGQLCVLPFVYMATSIPTCTNVNSQFYWCATSNNYDRDQQFGVCPREYACT